MIALSCGIKISAVRHLVLSQSTRVTDGQTDGGTDRRTDRQNYDSQDRPRICSRGKNGGLDQYGTEPFEQQQFRKAGVEGPNGRTNSSPTVLSSSSTRTAMSEV